MSTMSMSIMSHRNVIYSILFKNIAHTFLHFSAIFFFSEPRVGEWVNFKKKSSKFVGEWVNFEKKSSKFVFFKKGF